MRLSKIEAARRVVWRRGLLDSLDEVVRPEVLASWRRSAAVKREQVAARYVGHEPDGSPVIEAEVVFDEFFADGGDVACSVALVGRPAAGLTVAALRTMEAPTSWESRE